MSGSGNGAVLLCGFSSLDAYKEHGVKKYKFVATMDAGTCAVCGGLDGQVFLVEDFEVGVNAPPMHPNDRCTTAPYFGELKGQDGDGMMEEDGAEADKHTLKYKPSSGAVLEADPNRTTTILGTYKADTATILNELGNIKSTDFGPKPGKFNLLNTPDELYVTPEQFWNDYNQPWMDNVIQRGDKIILATEPTYGNLYRTNKDTGVQELTGFGREFQYLRDNGYIYDEVLKQMIK